jgi:hypothetical protein
VGGNEVARCFGGSIEDVQSIAREVLEDLGGDDAGKLFKVELERRCHDARRS